MKPFTFGLFIFFVGLLAMTSCNNSKNKVNKNPTNQPKLIQKAVPMNWAELGKFSDSSLTSNICTFRSIYLKGKNTYCFDLKLFFVSNTIDSMFGIYSLYINHDESFLDKHLGDREFHKYDWFYSDYDTLIHSHAVGVFQIKKDSLFLEHSLPLHYQDSLCKKLSTLDSCICNPNNTRNAEELEYYKVYGDYISTRLFFFNPTIVKAAFALEIKPVTFFLQTIVANQRAKNNFKKKYPKLKILSKYYAKPIILHSVDNLKINFWASQEEIRKKYPANISEKKIDYPLFKKKELDITNTYTFLSNGEGLYEEEKVKHLFLLLELTDKNYADFGDCSVIDIVDIYELLLDYTTKERLKREKK